MGSKAKELGAPTELMDMKEISWKRFGYHVVYDTNMYDAIDFARRHGFGYIVPDLMIPRFFPERFSRAERQRLREFATSRGVSISFHGPSDHLNLGALYPEVKKAVLDRMKMCLDFTRDVGAERFTIHTAPPLDFVLAGKRGTYLRNHWSLYKDALKESLIKLSEYSQGNVLLCVENAPLDEIAMEVLEELLPRGNVFLTWDICKSHTSEGKPIVQVEDFFTRHLERVRECHLHDQKPRRPSHDIIGVGKIDFAHYLKILVPQDIHFTIEVRPRENAFKSLEELEKILGNLDLRISRPS